uniref:Uncharacterized protein n=1 Tax=Oncorhynchus tshawytscha TaxID=74940 RepID=A0AAZ3QCI7_ONCTS
MSADNSCADVSVPLRNLLNSVQCVRDRVKDGESNESNGVFNLSNFWDTLMQAVKAASQEATKLSLAFSKPPLPTQEDGEKFAESIQKSVLALSTVYYWLPKSHGITLRRLVRDATAEVLDGIVQLVDVIVSSPLQSLSQEQLQSTGGVWSACDQFAHLPRDNRAAVLGVLASYIGVVKDAIEEMEQAQAESQDPFSDVLDDEDQDSRGNQDTYWSEEDRQLMAPCQGLMKASAACLRKLLSAVKANGNVSMPETVAQLDDLADISKEISPRKMPRVPAHLRERALGMLQGGMRTADVARAINDNVRTETPRQRYRGGRTDSQSSSQWQTMCNYTCTESVHPNITPAGQVQDGNNNCLSYTRDAQSLHWCSDCPQSTEAELRACRPVVRQVLTRHHRQQLRLWAQTHRCWTCSMGLRSGLFTGHDRTCWRVISG